MDHIIEPLYVDEHIQRLHERVLRVEMIEILELILKSQYRLDSHTRGMYQTSCIRHIRIESTQYALLEWPCLSITSLSP